MPVGAIVPENRYRWAAPGDVNAFFGLMLDNIADMLLTVGLLAGVFGFPVDFALGYMVPGTAIGVLVGDLFFFWLAFRTAKLSGNKTLTAMPLGLDTPSTFGMVFFVLGPAYRYGLAMQGGETPEDITAAAMYAWQIGVFAIVTSGLFKLVCAFFSNAIRRNIPRAGLLGSLAAVALVLISFLPLLEVLHYPVVGLIALSIVLTTLIARVRLPFKVPGALGAMLVAGLMFYLLHGPPDFYGQEAELAKAALLPHEWLSVFNFEWLGVWRDALNYMPVVIPFALGTVVGGIDCTESAAAAGDEFDTNQVIAGEAIATLIAGLCGGVIQTTPYIGHPAYKAMGGRAAYTLATALFVGGAGLLGYFGFLYLIIPKASVFPILVFIGIEITSQSFQATPRKHYPAVAFACVPAMAALLLILADKMVGEVSGQLSVPPDIALSKLSEAMQLEIHTLRVLASGFIITSLLWASWLAAVLDKNLTRAGDFALAAAACSFFGVIHSPLSGSPIFWPSTLAAEAMVTPLQYTSGYLCVALLMYGWQFYNQRFLDHDSTPAAEALAD